MVFTQWVTITPKAGQLCKKDTVAGKRVRAGPAWKTWGASLRIITPSVSLMTGLSGPHEAGQHNCPLRHPIPCVSWDSWDIPYPRFPNFSSGHSDLGILWCIATSRFHPLPLPIWDSKMAGSMGLRGSSEVWGCEGSRERLERGWWEVPRVSKSMWEKLEKNADGACGADCAAWFHLTEVTASVT